MLKNLSFGKIGLSLLLLLGVVGIKAQTRTYESVPNDPMKTRIYTSTTGWKSTSDVNKEKPRIQTYIAVRTGSRNDPAETTGLAHYLEHIMFKGTDKGWYFQLRGRTPLSEANWETLRRVSPHDRPCKAQGLVSQDWLCVSNSCTIQHS